MNASSPGWFSRHWKWLVPVGCLTLIVGAVAIGAVIGLGLHGLYERSGMADPYRDGLAAAQAHPAVRQALGTPLERGFMMSGRINVENDRGDADLRFPIHGPRGKGRVHVVGELVQGRWQYRVLDAELDGVAAPIDLRAQLPAPPATD